MRVVSDINIGDFFFLYERIVNVDTSGDLKY